MIIDNLEKVIMKHGVSDAVLTGGYATATITVQIPGVGNRSFPGYGRKPTTVIATVYNTEGHVSYCAVKEILSGGFTVDIAHKDSQETYYRVHWLAIWD